MGISFVGSDEMVLLSKKQTRTYGLALLECVKLSLHLYLLLELKASILSETTIIMHAI